MSTPKSSIPELTFGAIEKLMNGELLDNVVLQILGHKKISDDRYRLLLNDGIRTCPNAILPTSLGNLISSRILEKYSVFRLNDYKCDSVSPESKVLICFGIEVIAPGSEVNGKISFDRSSLIARIVKSDVSDNAQVKLNCRKGDGCVVNVSSPKVSRQDYFNSNALSSPSCSFINTERAVAASSDFTQNKSETVFKRPDIVNRTYHSPNSSKRKMFYSQQPLGNNGRSNGNFNAEFFKTCPYTESQRTRQTFYPIQSLSPYMYKWTIKARVSHKSEVINYNNSRGEGKFFSFILLDSSGEIKAMVFNDSVERFYDVIKTRSVYYISNASVRLSRAEPRIIKNDYEISFNLETQIAECQDNVCDIPMFKFNFIPISQIESTSENTFIDVIGVCNSASEVISIPARSNNREVLKRDFQLVDETSAVLVTLWGEEAKKFNQSGITVVALKGAKVVSFNKLALSVSSSITLLYVNPDIEETHKLRRWYQKLNKYEFNLISRDFTNTTLQNCKTLYEINMLDFNDRTYYYSTKATVILVHKDKCMYKACPSDDCSKKVIEAPNGLYKCDKCNREYNTYKWVLMLNMNIADFFCDINLVAFKEKAEAILGISSEELVAAKERDEDEYYEILSNIHFRTLTFKLCSKMEMFNDINRLKTIVIASSPLEPVIYGRKLLSDIKHMETILNN